MMRKDSKIPPQDDYTNIELLKNNHKHMESLIKANGLRIHLYFFLQDIIEALKVHKSL